MKDIWGDTIDVEVEDASVYLTTQEGVADFQLSPAKARKLARKLLNAAELAES